MTLIYMRLPKFQSQQVRDPRNQEKKKLNNYRTKGRSDSGPPCRKVLQKIISPCIQNTSVNC